MIYLLQWMQYGEEQEEYTDEEDDFSDRLFELLAQGFTVHCRTVNSVRLAWVKRERENDRTKTMGISGA